MKYILFSFLLITSILSNAQRPGGYEGQMPMDASLSGIIYDIDTDTPVEYANIVLYKKKDSTMVSGTIADVKGTFLMEKLPYGRFYAEISFIGYKKKFIEEIFIKPPQKDVNLGTIKIEKNIQAIKEVEIVADKKYVEYKIDKKVINVGQDIIAAGGSAVDVLENTPSIQTDIDGNVSLRGSSNFKVLVDGKPSVLESDEILQQIPASSIDNIEIITNPSAKYEPDGVAGIINVVLKKQKEKGFSGIVNGKVGTFNNYGIDALFNYRSGKFNFFAGAGYDNSSRRGSGTSRRESSLDDEIFYISKEVERGGGHDRLNGKLGFDYNINKSNSFSLSGEIGQGGFKRFAYSNTHDYTEPVSINNYYTSNSDFDVTRKYYSVTSTYMHQFERKGHEFLITGFYSNKNGDNDGILVETETDSYWNDLGVESYMNQSLENSASNDLDMKIDYTRPIGEKGKFEAGYQIRDYYQATDYINSDFNYILDDWQENDSLRNSIDFDQLIQSAYTTFSNQFKGFEFLLGFRGEYTYRNITDAAGVEYIVDRMDYFPSVHISKPINKILQAQASYSRRINRPQEYYLDPFINYMDKYNARQGNPDLLPEFTDSYEINLQAKFDKSFISLETYRRQTNNLIDRISRLGDNNVMMTTFENISRDLAIGSELMYNNDIKKWWTINASLNVFHYSIEGELYDNDISQSTFTWDTRMSSTLKIKSNTRIQINGSYRAPTIEAYEEEYSSYAIGMAVKQDFFNRKLALTVNMRDIFNTGRHSSYSYGEGFKLYDDFKSKYPSIIFSLSYKINNYKQQQKRDQNRDDMGGDEM
ncbi:MAG TPA: hypothetical protein DDX39_10080 [Bacteroidales bacterium]|nr:MAG: hypothetical protein A2W98_01295 [Bacteroidetes bacterium GWF2_33_38]OFY75172.1 MAG: hypothetical protein A2265_05155 [Bacteroidetes bacterium RIFOXYA12_FULL_33_9]HBF88978.1 hypothetical protein [Bacteroidales bacterium]